METGEAIGNNSLGRRRTFLQLCLGGKASLSFLLRLQFCSYTQLLQFGLQKQFVFFFSLAKLQIIGHLA
jgi:hypothetical protein